MRDSHHGKMAATALLLILIVACSIAPRPSVHKLSVGGAVPVDELEGIGRIGGCTATLISQELVITAAHCVCPSDTSTEGCNTSATFTLMDVFPVDDPSTSIDESSTREDVKIPGSVRVHPAFGIRGWLREDIAVVELETPANHLVIGVEPVAIAKGFAIPRSGDNLTLVGFGRTGPMCSGLSQGKRKLTLKAQEVTSAAIRFLHPGRHSCPGDSGGPVLNPSGHVVGVASWANDVSESVYRPTHPNTNWILGHPQFGWISCTWKEVGGHRSHQPGEPWCPEGNFLTQLDLDTVTRASGHDSPVVGRARCCALTEATPTSWGACSWERVGAVESYQSGQAWCPEGTFLTQFDLDGEGELDALDAPIVGQARCCRLADDRYGRWGSSVLEVVGPRSLQGGNAWCPPGTLLTQFELDRDLRVGTHESPLVGLAKCSMPRP